MAITIYELLEAKSEYCVHEADRCLKKGDFQMGDFWRNAAEGYKAKQNKLNISEAGEEIV